MNTQQLEYIIAISEEKSLSRAADRMMVSEPALSQQVKKLEKELDAKLFVRVKNELVLTDAGRVYVNGAHSLISTYSRALKEIQKLKNSGRRQITLVYNNILLPSFSNQILPAFLELHRDVYLSTIDGNASVAKDYLNGGMADLAILATRELSHSILEYIPLRDEELMLAVPADHPCLPGFLDQGVDFNCLKEDSFILNQSNSFFRTLERETFGLRQFTPNVLCEISDLNAAHQMVVQQRGIAFLPRSMEQTSDRCICLPLDPPAVFHIVIAYHKGFILTRPIRDLIMLLLKTYETT